MENKNKGLMKKSLITLMVSASIVGAFVVGNKASDFLYSHVENSVLKVSEFSDIEAAIKKNPQLSEIDILGVSTTKIKDLYFVAAKNTNFYYHPESNSVINGMLFNAESGVNETRILNEIVLQNAKLRGRDVSSQEPVSSSHNKSPDLKAENPPVSVVDPEKLEKLKQKLSSNDSSDQPDYSKLSFKEKDVKESASLDKYSLDGRVNPKEIERYRSHIQYKGKQFSRIGYDQDGKKLPSEVEKEQIKNLVKNIKEKQDEWTVTYKAPNEKYSVVAFTDPTCPVCKKFHTKVEELNKNGVTVHYLFYPRTMQLGLEDSRLKSTIAQMDSIWYSEDKKKAMDDVYAGYRPRGKEVEQNIKNPVFEHYLVGEFVGVEGTPTILMDNGNRLTGFGQTKGLLRMIVE